MISVIVPVYNCIDTLERCVRTILAQTMSDWELLLINDGSKDGSAAMCDRLATLDSRICVFHKTNGGVSSARNLGLDHANGDYVMFCDSDDWVEPDWCEIMQNQAKAHPDSLSLCNYYRSRPSGESVNSAAPEKSVPKADFFSLNRQELLGIPWNKIYRRDLLEKGQIRFRPDISLGEDLMFVLDYLDVSAGGLNCVSAPLYHYSLGNSDSLSAKYYPDLDGLYRVLYGRIMHALQSVPGAWENWQQEFLRSYFHAFDRVFRNTLSEKNPLPFLRKHRYNAGIFHSAAFQQCRRAVLQDRRNILQKVGLLTNCYGVYWASVVVSEAISGWLHRR